MTACKLFPPDEWKRFQASVPITCVDVLHVRFARGVRRAIDAIGLIYRDTPHQGKRWCLIGGRLCRVESLHDAIRRQLRETLGSRVRPVLRVGQQPACVAEYSPSGKKPFGLDPRQHSVGLTYAVEVRGLPVAQGEAIRFEWFPVKSLPPSRYFGFNQDRVVRDCIKLLHHGM